MNRIIILALITFMVSMCGEYSRGDRFSANFDDDSLTYVVAAQGWGREISDIASRMKTGHESKGNSCELNYLTDSSLLNDKKGLLLMNSTLPDIEEDFLTKGFFGQFTSKQVVSILLVSKEDLDKFLIKKD